MADPVHDASNHKLLSADAAALDADVFSEHNLLAEELLALDGTTLGDLTDLTGRDAEKAVRAVALQINRQVFDGVDAAALYSFKDGDVTIDYANSPLRPSTGVDAKALALAVAVIDKTLGTTEEVRPRPASVVATTVPTW